MTSSPERTPKKTPTVALAIACLSVAIATAVNTCHIAYSIHVTIFSLYDYGASLASREEDKLRILKTDMENLSINLKKGRIECRGT
jgi:hypothetical protein